MRIGISDTLNALTRGLGGVNLPGREAEQKLSSISQKAGDSFNKIFSPVDRFELSTREAASAASSLLKTTGSQIYSLSNIMSRGRESPLLQLKLAATNILKQDLHATGGFERGIFRTSSYTHDSGQGTSFSMSTLMDASLETKANFSLSQEELKPL